MESSSKHHQLLEWFRGGGGYLHPNVALVEDAFFGLSLQATADLKVARDSGASENAPELAVCTCPITLSLSTLNAAGTRPEIDRTSLNIRTDVSPVASQLAGEVDETVIAYFVLMEQRILGKESFWHPYIASLPTDSELTTPLFFEDDDLVWLAGTTMHAAPGNSAIEKRRDLWRGQWQQAIGILEKKQLDVSAFTFNLYQWAATIYTSRAFTSSAAFDTPAGTFPILYPGSDLLNHSTSAKVAWSFSKGDFSVCTLEDISTGSQVFNNYAPKDNDELLMGMGFVIEDSLADQVLITMPKPPLPVHANLRRALPDHFKSETWDPEEAAFHIRGTSHYAGGYDHGISCLRAVPYAMFRMMAELVYFMTTRDVGGAGEALEDEDFFAFVVEQFLNPLRAKRAGVPEIAAVPKNQRQEFARIYRDGQIKIMDEVIGELERYLDDR